MAQLAASEAKTQESPGETDAETCGAVIVLTRECEFAWRAVFEALF